MNCIDVRPRLVAFQDGELSPGEQTQVVEHLHSCTDCTEHELQLAAVTPEPFLDIPDADLDAKWLRLDEVLAAELDHPVRIPVPAPMWLRVSNWLSEEMPMSTGTVLAYAAALMLVAMWGANNWKTAHDLQMAAQAAPERPLMVIAPSAEIPESDFRFSAGEEMDSGMLQPAIHTPEPLTADSDER